MVTITKGSDLTYDLTKCISWRLMRWTLHSDESAILGRPKKIDRSNCNKNIT